MKSRYLIVRTGSRAAPVPDGREARVHTLRTGVHERVHRVQPEGSTSFQVIAGTPGVGRRAPPARASGEVGSGAAVRWCVGSGLHPRSRGMVVSRATHGRAGPGRQAGIPGTVDRSPSSSGSMDAGDRSAGPVLSRRIFFSRFLAMGASFPAAATRAPPASSSAAAAMSTMVPVPPRHRDDAGRAVPPARRAGQSFGSLAQQWVGLQLPFHLVAWSRATQRSRPPAPRPAGRDGRVSHQFRSASSFSMSRQVAASVLQVAAHFLQREAGACGPTSA